ncbi:MAG: amino acid transporter [Cyanobacteria bacterium REEB67]|nr:amino acid transporter [Cyanobacteria bacterium REEB67]
MCLTGVDYFSTLGYQPGIAFLAAGVLSPIATLILVVVTLAGALPVYCIVARESPNGQGSVAMLERMLPGWQGKVLVLLLLGFAATAFIITITLSAADATAHIVENPILAEALRGQRVPVTLVLLALLGGLFLKGFREAIGLSFFIVIVYLALSAAILVDGMVHLAHHPELWTSWHTQIFREYQSLPTMFGVGMLLFPKLALGLSGFETGVAVMPLVKGFPTDTAAHPEGRIKNARKLLICAAAIMSVFLVISSIVTTLLIPASYFQEGGPANGRALAYLAHSNIGPVFGTIYDVSTILILWFAGASAIAGLLSLVPKYLPRYGMAPSWSSAIRPLVVFFTSVAFGVTIMFKADVDAQAAAYATGVLVLITSAAIAATISVWKKSTALRIFFSLVSFVFVYTAFANMSERPEGVHIALFFITAILIASVLSRAIRSTELRVDAVHFDEKAQEFIDYALHHHWGEIRILPHRSGMYDFRQKVERSRRIHSIQEAEGDFIILEVALTDSSEFSHDLLVVRGVEQDGYKVLRCSSPAVPNAIAAILLNLRDRTGQTPHVYFAWTDGHPIAYTLKYIFLGEGETAMVTREILRSEELSEHRRPIVHVG